MKFRHEYKQTINFADTLQLKNKLPYILDRDEYADENGVYVVKSLYFDNYMDKALKEKQDGVIRVKSEKGKGSEFRVEI